MTTGSETTRTKRIMGVVSRVFSTKNLGALWIHLQSVFTCCMGEQQSVTVQERQTCEVIQGDECGQHRYLSNKELLEKLTDLESRFTKQTELLKRHALRTGKVMPGSVKRAKRYNGDIEPDLLPRTDLDPQGDLLDKVKPTRRYDDERFEELDRLVLKYIMTRVSRGVRGNSARPVGKESRIVHKLDPTVPKCPCRHESPKQTHQYIVINK